MGTALALQPCRADVQCAPRVHSVCAALCLTQHQVHDEGLPVGAGCMSDAGSILPCAGTYHYMAPEVIRHEMYDSRADVYSWGVLFAEILQQQPPYEGLYCTPVQV